MKGRRSAQDEIGGVVAAVLADSIAAEVGILPGDKLLAINDHAVHDIIDVQFYGAEETLTLTTFRDNETLIYEIERDYDEDLGLEFTSVTFDGIRRCRCRCPFCFVHQMPPGQRRSLYVRDDDYRYSFLFNSFVTLTNLDRADWERIGAQYLSPLYVSVHATELGLRRALLGNPRTPDVLAQIRGLGEMGIDVHAQIVLVPEMNDGQHLERSLDDLASLYPTVQSIAIVPVGLTRFHSRGLRTFRPDECGALLAQIGPRQETARRDHGTTLIYAADEFYLLAEEPIPPVEHYDDFAQLENGIGLTRQLLEQWNRLRPRLGTIKPSRRQATVVCGTLIAPILRPILDEIARQTGLALTLLPVSNRFFGATVTVSGLLTGQDVVAALRHREPGEMVILPQAMLDQDGSRTLDDMTCAEMAKQIGAPVATAASLEALLYL